MTKKLKLTLFILGGLSFASLYGDTSTSFDSMVPEGLRCFPENRSKLAMEHSELIQLRLHAHTVLMSTEGTEDMKEAARNIIGNLHTFENQYFIDALYTSGSAVCSLKSYANFLKTCQFLYEQKVIIANGLELIQVTKKDYKNADILLTEVKKLEDQVSYFQNKAALVEKQIAFLKQNPAPVASN